MPSPAATIRAALRAAREAGQRALSRERSKSRQALALVCHDTIKAALAPVEPRTCRAVTPAVTIDAPAVCTCWTPAETAGQPCGWCGTWTPPADVATLASARGALSCYVAELERLASVA
jgi:hypothetical protein